MTKYSISSPFSNELGGLIDNLFNRNIGDFIGRDLVHGSPSVNIVETKTAYRIDVAAPGLEKTDFNIQFEKNSLTVCAKATTTTATDPKTDTYKRREFDYRNFERRFNLPKDVNNDQIQATYQDGILAITLSKSAVAEEKTNTTIEIN